MNEKRILMQKKSFLVEKSFLAIIFFGEKVFVKIFFSVKKNVVKKKVFCFVEKVLFGH